MILFISIVTPAKLQGLPKGFVFILLDGGLKRQPSAKKHFLSKINEPYLNKMYLVREITYFAACFIYENVQIFYFHSFIARFCAR
jgi:hypothetical protein